LSYTRVSQGILPAPAPARAFRLPFVAKPGRAPRAALYLRGVNHRSRTCRTSNLGWGIGLAAHGLSGFVGRGLLGADWEERKIREYLDRRPWAP